MTPQRGRFTLELAQSCKPTPGQADKQPFVIPIALGLVGATAICRSKSPPRTAPARMRLARGVFELDDAAAEDQLP